MDLTIIIVSFKSGDILERCLDSIDSKYPIIVVENSLDKNLKIKIEKKYQNVECILPETNLGYGAANNLGIKKVKTKYLLILNPDTILFENTLEQLLYHAKKIEDFAILGPKILEGDKIENEEIDKKNIIKTEDGIEKSISYVKGFAIFINKPQFEKIGFFDENFFLYFEEIDLCKRVIQSGKKIFLIPKAIIKHVGGQSHIKSINKSMELSRNWHWMWSTFYYHKKHGGFLFALFKISKKLLSSLFKVILFTIFLQKQKREIYKHRLSGIINSINGKKAWYRPKFNDQENQPG
tara:strand:+ start:799 stop:1680 length:882 start_codon:yes stop_codon:yes gene_type:complete